MSTAIKTESVERQIARKVITAMIERDYSLRAFCEGQPVDYDRGFTTNVDEIVEDVFVGDECVLKALPPGTESAKSWIMLIPGNGEDILSDYSTDLEPILGSIE